MRRQSFGMNEKAGAADHEALLPLHWPMLEWSLSGPPRTCETRCQSALSPELWIMPQMFSSSKSHESIKLKEEATKAKKESAVSAHTQDDLRDKRDRKTTRNVT